MVAAVDAFHRFFNFFHRLVGNRERCVHAEHALDHVLVIGIDGFHEIDVLFNFLIGDRFTVAI